MVTDYLSLFGPTVPANLRGFDLGLVTASRLNEAGIEPSKEGSYWKPVEEILGRYSQEMRQNGVPTPPGTEGEEFYHGLFVGSRSDPTAPKMHLLISKCEAELDPKALETFKQYITAYLKEHKATA